MAHAFVNKGNPLKAKKLAKKYKSNENRILAESVVMELLLESTTLGEFTLTALRDELLEIYGTNSENNNELKTVYDVASTIIDQVIEEQFGQEIKNSYLESKDVIKITDITKFKVAAGLGADIIFLQAKNEILLSKIKYYDKYTYYHTINRLDEYWKYLNIEGGGFGGAGSASNY